MWVLLGPGRSRVKWLPPAGDITRKALLRTRPILAPQGSASHLHYKLVSLNWRIYRCRYFLGPPKTCFWYLLNCTITGRQNECNVFKLQPGMQCGRVRQQLSATTVNWNVHVQGQYISEHQAREQQRESCCLLPFLWEELGAHRGKHDRLSWSIF